VLHLLSQLPADEQEKLRAKLNSKSKAERWQALFSKVQGQSKDLPPLSDQDILADVKAIREELKAQGAEGGN
jgi:hypothetical protein